MPKATKNEGTIGGRVAQLRIDAGLSQKELADDLIVERVLVNYWENNKRPIKTDDVVKLATKFDVTCDYILRGIEAENLNIHEKTGLSDEAITAFIKLANEKISESSKTIISGSDILNDIIINDNFLRLIKQIVYSSITRKRCELTPIEPGDYEIYRYLEHSADKEDALFSEWKVEHFAKEWAINVFNSFYSKQESILKKLIYENEDDFYDKFGGGCWADDRGNLGGDGEHGQHNED